MRGSSSSKRYRRGYDEASNGSSPLYLRTLRYEPLEDRRLLDGAGFNISEMGRIGGNFCDADVVGSYLYAATVGELVVFDVSDVAHSVRMGSYDIAGDARSVYVADDLAYVTDRGGLQIVDVSNPAAPVRIGGIGGLGDTHEVQVVGSFAYVAAEAWGLQIVDVSNPQSPVRVGQYDTAGYARSVDVVGNLAYVADATDGLQILNVNNPTTPTLVGSFDTAGSALDVQVALNRAYVADFESGLRIIDVTNPAAPTDLGGYDTGNARGIQVAGELAYIADGESGQLVIVNVTTPTAPVPLATYSTGGLAWNVDLQGNLAFVADGGGGFDIIDVSSPATPTHLGGYASVGTPRNVQVVGSTGYLANDRLEIVNLNDPANPTHLGGYDTAGTAYAVQVVGNLAYTANYGNGLQILDVTNPATPSSVGSCAVPGDAFSIQVIGNTAFIASGSQGLQVVNVSSPASPSVIGSYDTPGMAWGVEVVGTLAYVADETAGLQIVDVSNPALPVLVGSYDTPDQAYDVQVIGSTAYVADRRSGLQVLDVTNPAAPVWRSKYDTVGEAYGVQVVGHLGYIADGGSGLAIVDVNDPANPLLLTEFDTPGSAYGVNVAGSFAYVADVDGGLRVLSLLNPVAEAAGPYSVNEGAAVVLDSSASTHPTQPSNTLDYKWDLDSDGVFGESGVAALRGDENGATPVFSPFGLDGPTSCSVRLRVTDNEGYVDTDTATIQITNTAPTASITWVNDGFQGVSGQSRTFTLAATDPSSADQAANFTYFIDWKDGSTETIVGLSPKTVNHAFSYAGTFTPSIYATDKDNTAGASTNSQARSVLAVERQGTAVAVGGSDNSDSFALAQTSTAGRISISVNLVSRGIWTLAAGNTIRLYADSATDQVAVTGTAGWDTLEALGTAARLNGYLIEGQEVENWKFYGLGGTDTLSGPNQPNTWALGVVDAGTINSSITFSGIEKLVGGSRADTFQFSSQTQTYTSIDGDDGGGDTLDYSSLGGAVSINIAASVATLVNRFGNIENVVGTGVAGSRLRGGNGTNTWVVNGANTCTANGTSFSGFTDITGGQGADTFLIQPGGSMSGRLDGATGSNVLDYSFYPSAVTVNLATGFATAITGGVRNIRMIVGTAFDDMLAAGASPMVLLGGAGVDTLRGGAGRDLLVGGTGSDELRGGDGDDILFGGTTTYYNESTKNANLKALDMILQQWNATSAYSRRVAKLAAIINSSSFTDDAGEADELYGDAGLDWFLTKSGDSVHDPESGEITSVL